MPRKKKKETDTPWILFFTTASSTPWPGAPSRPWLCQNGRIALAGTDEAALALADAHTKKIDLGGRCVLPGFTDSHMHILQAGMVCHRLDLRGVTSLQEIIDRGQDYVKHADLAPGEWIIGYGFDHNSFDPPTLPDGATAEAISSDLPVILDRVCGHIGAANRKAFELAGYDENTVIPGGELDKDEHGHLNGIIREAALDQIKRSSPRQTKEQVIARIQEIGTQLAAAGLTSVHSDDVGMEGTKWPILKEAFADMEAENSCPVRLWEEWEAPRPADLQWVLTQPLRSGQGSDWLKVGNIKLISDGQPGRPHRLSAGGLQRRPRQPRHRRLHPGGHGRDGGPLPRCRVTGGLPRHRRRGL